MNARWHYQRVGGPGALGMRLRARPPTGQRTDTGAAAVTPHRARFAPPTR